jgi:hypothetical protein
MAENVHPFLEVHPFCKFKAKLAITIKISQSEKLKKDILSYPALIKCCQLLLSKLK